MTKEEAIKELRGFIGQLTEGCQEAIKVLIPELAETEDEKIREELIDFIQWAEDRGMTRNDYHQAKRPMVWIAYLEKQKEMPTNEEMLRTLRAEYEKGVADTIAKYEKKEQKHPDGCFTCDEYKKGYEAGRSNGFTAGYNKAMKEQKPVEWSEKDRNMLNSILLYFNAPFHDMDDIEKNMFIWLQSLPERFNLESKQEWSEEDEEMRNRCISSIEEAKDNRYYYKETDGDTSYDEEIAWLKSLRPQPKQEWSKIDEQISNGLIKALENLSSDWLKLHGVIKSDTIAWLKCHHNHLSWKPSDAQMMALKEDADKYWEMDGSDPLYTLYQDLKKLM